MNDSPFGNLANTALTFAVPTGGVIRGTDGNPEAETVPVEVSAMLRMPNYKDAAQLRHLPGVDETAILLEGWCVEPKLLPSQITPNQWVKCKWSGTSGWFYLMHPIGGRYGNQGVLGEIINGATGTQISGLFQIRKLI
jgi:hypothetical protein